MIVIVMVQKKSYRQTVERWKCTIKLMETKNTEQGQMQNDAEHKGRDNRQRLYKTKQETT